MKIAESVNNETTLALSLTNTNESDHVDNDSTVHTTMEKPASDTCETALSSLKNTSEAKRLASFTSRNERNEADNDDSISVSSISTVIKWSKEEECILLLSALDDPIHVFEHGYPTLSSSSAITVDECMQKEKYLENNICNHWDDMLEECHNHNNSTNSRSSIVSNTISNERTLHIMNTCMVLAYEQQARQTQHQQHTQKLLTKTTSKKYKESMQNINSITSNLTSQVISTLKSNVLLSCGWRILPFKFLNTTTTTTITIKCGVPTTSPPSIINFERSKWHRPSVTLKVSTILTEKDFIASSMHINDAWEEHLQELRNGIECDLPPPPPATPIKEDLYEIAVSPFTHLFNLEEQPQDETAPLTPVSTTGKEKQVKKGRKESKFKVNPLVIPKHVMNMMTARSRFVSEGDPRPSIHCTWCGPKQWSRKVHKQLAKDNKTVSEGAAPAAPATPPGPPGPPAHVICQACQVLYKDGWRMDDTSSNSNTFLSSTANNRRWADYVFRNKAKGMSLRSVKTFLLQTSPYVADILKKNPSLNQEMEETMLIPRLPKERGSGGGGNRENSEGVTTSKITTTVAATRRPAKRRKIIKEEETSEEEESLESSSSSSSDSESEEEDQQHQEEEDSDNDEDDNHSSSTHLSSKNNNGQQSNNTIHSSIDDIAMLPTILSTIPSNNQQHAQEQRVLSSLKLPTIDDLLKEEYGLSGILQSDEYGILNVHFGSDAEIICQVLAPLTTGKLPRIVLKETPFLRSKEEVNYLHPEGGPPPARFMGVTRIFEKKDSLPQKQQMGPNGKFGVEIPLLFYKGRKVVVRDMDREDVAGILFVFLYRLLFGTKALEDMRIVVNDYEERKDFIFDTLSSFGATITTTNEDNPKNVMMEE